MMTWLLWIGLIAGIYNVFIATRKLFCNVTDECARHCSWLMSRRKHPLDAIVASMATTATLCQAVIAKPGKSAEVKAEFVAMFKRVLDNDKCE